MFDLLNVILFVQTANKILQKNWNCKSMSAFLSLRNFVANLALSQLRVFLGALFAEIWWRGHKNISVDRVLACPTWICVMWPIWMSPFILNICARPWHYSVHYVRTFAPVLIGTLKSSKKITVWFECCSKMVNTEQKTEGPGQRPGVPCTFVILLDDLSVVLW